MHGIGEKFSAGVTPRKHGYHPKTSSAGYGAYYAPRPNRHIYGLTVKFLKHLGSWLEPGNKVAWFNYLKKIKKKQEKLQHFHFVVTHY